MRSPPDILIKSALDYSIADLRKNAWLLPNVLGCHLNGPLTRVEYGNIEFLNGSQWFLETNIQTVMYLRKDISKIPCISVALLSSEEIKENTSLGDVAFHQLGMASPQELERPPIKTYPNFTPPAYDPTTGTITLPSDLNAYKIAPHLMAVVESKTGKGYQIKKILSANQFTIAPDSQLDLNDIYIAPVADFFNLDLGRTRFRDTVEIGCHGGSQPQECLWLSQIIEYILLKNKMRGWEEQGLTNISFRSSNASKNDNYTADTVYSKFFTVSYEMECDWIKGAYPRIYKVNECLRMVEGPCSPEEFQAQIHDKNHKDHPGHKDHKKP